MTKSKYINLICILLTAVTVLVTGGLLISYALANSEADSSNSGTEMAYETDLFDDSSVHTLNITMDDDDWDELADHANSEDYYVCDLVLDGNAVQNVAIRAKGNTSLKQVSSYGNDRYSLKIEFDHYQDGKNYEGLDKLALNNLIQDNTCMKDYLAYKMMAAMGAEAPLCSFIYVTVNGEDWGLYLAAEGIEESFAQRNYSSDSNQIYKPDFENTGGRGNTSDALKLQYSDDKISSYEEIFDTAEFDLSEDQKRNFIEALKTLDNGENLEDALNTNEIIRYFVVHNFLLNGDSYTGSMLHNYYLHEGNGQLSLIAWDYNLAFGGFSSGNNASGNSATSLVNYPIDDPLLGSSMEDRPMIAWIFNNTEYTDLYHQYFDEFISTCFESSWFEETFENAYKLIAPYIKKDTNGFVSYDDFVTACDTLKSFVDLRAESIRGQLDGTISSTESGQSKNSSALIDASSLKINDMGSNGGGEGNNPTQENRDTTQQPSDTQQDHTTTTTAKNTSVTSNGSTINLLTAQTNSNTQTQTNSSTNTAPSEESSTDSSDQEKAMPSGGMGNAPGDSSTADSSTTDFKNGQFGGNQGPGVTENGGITDPSGSTNTTDIRNTVFLTGGSLLLLLLALLLVSRYKRHRY